MGIHVCDSCILSTQIDNFFINSLFIPESVSGTLSADISDHLPLFLNCSSNYSSNHPSKIIIY